MPVISTPVCGVLIQTQELYLVYSLEFLFLKYQAIIPS